MNLQNKVADKRRSTSGADRMKRDVILVGVIWNIGAAGRAFDEFGVERKEAVSLGQFAPLHQVPVSWRDGRQSGLDGSRVGCSIGAG